MITVIHINGAGLVYDHIDSRKKIVSTVQVLKNLSHNCAFPHISRGQRVVVIDECAQRVRVLASNIDFEYLTQQLPDAELDDLFQTFCVLGRSIPHHLRSLIVAAQEESVTCLNGSELYHYLLNEGINKSPVLRRHDAGRPLPSIHDFGEASVPKRSRFLNNSLEIENLLQR